MKYTVVIMGLAVLMGAAAVPMQRASAAVIFSDAFTRPDNRDIDAVTTGITNNTGTVFAPSAVYSTPWVDPNNQLGGPDGTANNGGGQQIVNNEYQKNSPGTANLFVNHNFTNADILAAGGFSVSLDVNEINQSTDATKGAAIAVGMSLLEAQSGHDADDGTTSPATTVSKYTNALRNTAFTTGAVLADFYFGIRGGGTMAWGTGTPTGAAAPTIGTVGATTGTISADFVFSDFNAGSTVNYTVRYNGIAQGSGTFTWSDTNANYIGIDARDGVRVRMDNFSVTVVPEPTALGLAVAAIACAAGCIRRRRGWTTTNFG